MDIPVTGLSYRVGDELDQHITTGLTGMILDGSDIPPSGTLSWRAASPGVPITVTGSDDIVFNKNYDYRFSVLMREHSATAAANPDDGFMYLGWACYDRDHQLISPYHIIEVPGTRTRLRTALRPGDSVVNVASTSGWTAVQGSVNSYHLNSIIIWDWVDSHGYRWPSGTYSRHGIYATAAAPGYRSVASDSLGLSVPYAGPEVPAGTEISNTRSGGTYMYGLAQQKVSGSWTAYSVSAKGFAPEGVSSDTKFRQGTFYIRPMLLINRRRDTPSSAPSTTDMRVAEVRVEFPEARCYQTSTYKGGALTLWVDGLTVSHVDIWRTDQHGTNAMILRGGYNIEVKSGRVIVADPEVPFNETVLYKVVENVKDPTTVVPVLVQTSGCMVDDASAYPEDSTICSPIYLSDPLYPSEGDWFGLLGIDPLSYPPRSQIYDILARHAPVAVSQLRSTARTSMRFITRTLQERKDFLDIFQSGRILLYRNPDPMYPENNWYIAAGALTEERIASDHRNPHRRWSVEIAVVDRPVGKLAAGVDVNRIYDTYKDFEPDGLSTITPPIYGGPGIPGAYTDYTDYVHVLIGGASAGVSAVGTPQHGLSRYPTTQAALTSWSIV